MGFKLTSAAAACLLLFVALATGIQAADPELLTDFKVPPGKVAADLDGSFFTSMVLRNKTLNSNAFATVRPVNFMNLPVLEGLGTSVAAVTFPPKSVNRPHTHPRGTEILTVFEGILNVGLIDSASPPNLFTATLYPGDLFVFPRGLVHFQINRDPKVTVRAFATFSSASPGTIILPPTLFGTNIDIDVLTKSFEVSEDVIKALIAAQKM